MNKRKTFLVIMVIALFSSFFLLETQGKKLNGQLYNYVNIESKRLATNIVTGTVNEVLEENLTNNLFIITKNKQNEVELLDYNTKEVNRLLKLVNESIQRKLLKLEEGSIEDFAIAQTFKKGRFKQVKSGVLCEVPLSALKKNSIFANFGPYIPIKMSFIGSVTSNINTTITPYGFNSLVVEVTMHVEIEEYITMPTSSKKSIIEIDAPLTLKVIQGIIPEYYYIKGLEKSSNLYTTPEDQ